MTASDRTLLSALVDHSTAPRILDIHDDDCDDDACTGCDPQHLAEQLTGHARREALKAEGQRKADAWNAKYPVGTPVMAYPGVRPEDEVAVGYRQRVEKGSTFGGETDPTEGLKTFTRTPAWTLGHGEPVVSVEGYAGGIVLDHIDVIAKGGETRG
jgi:hypothetical protein